MTKGNSTKERHLHIWLFFLNWNKKIQLMFAPHAGDIAVIISSLIASLFHICLTIRRHFSLRQAKLCIGQRKYKQKFTTQGRKERPTDRPSEWIRARSLNSYFAFCKIVVKRKRGRNVKLGDSFNETGVIGEYLNYFCPWLYLLERARCIKCCAVIGYPRWQDGAVVSTQGYPPCARKTSLKAI